MLHINALMSQMPRYVQVWTEQGPFLYTTLKELKKEDYQCLKKKMIRTNTSNG